MEILGEFRIPRPREEVWRGLHDPELLRACIPGCEGLSKPSHTQFTGEVAIAFGPLQGRFSGIAAVSELDPPNAYRIDCEGESGGDGLVKGGALVRLRDDGAGGTILSYRADAQLGGRLAGIDNSAVAQAASGLADRFLACLSERLVVVGAPPPRGPILAPDAVLPSQPGRPVLMEPVASAPASGTTMEPVLSPTRRIPPVFWIAGLILIVLLLLWMFAR